MKTQVKVDDRKWRELKARLPHIAGAEVTVGIQSDAGVDQDGTPIAAYAAYNEFGTRNIPERPFLRNTTDSRAKVWGKAADIAIDRALIGTQDFATGLRMLGELAQRDVQDTIAGWTEPPNAESTIARKGSSQPLIDTGAMRQAIRYEVKV